MSNEFPERPPIYHDAWRLAIVASEYNSTYVDGLVKFASDELSLLLPESNFATLRVPGSFEIPLGTKIVIETLNVHAVLAFGLLFDGETMHAGLIAGAVTKALLDLSLTHRVPVLHEVLVCKTPDQAKERCLMPEINRGTEAARAAVRMLAALRSLRAA
jgi:6,7-dimethyl-8-ribityllumazine synthase